MTDKLDDLIAECAKEKAICDDGNPSKFHKERLAELQKEIAKATPKPKKESPTVVETTATTSTDSNSAS